MPTALRRYLSPGVGCLLGSARKTSAAAAGTQRSEESQTPQAGAKGCARIPKPSPPDRAAPRRRTLRPGGRRSSKERSRASATTRPSGCPPRRRFSQVLAPSKSSRRRPGHRPRLQGRRASLVPMGNAARHQRAGSGRVVPGLAQTHFAQERRAWRPRTITPNMARPHPPSRRHTCASSASSSSRRRRRQAPCPSYQAEKDPDSPGHHSSSPVPTSNSSTNPPTTSIPPHVKKSSPPCATKRLRHPRHSVPVPVTALNQRVLRSFRRRRGPLGRQLPQTW